MDETYIRVRGEWKYLYRAVDKQGNTVDFLLSEHRDIAAAKRFFTRAIERQGAPEKVTAEEDYFKVSFAFGHRVAAVEVLAHRLYAVRAAAKNRLATTDAVVSLPCERSPDAAWHLHC